MNREPFTVCRVNVRKLPVPQAMRGPSAFLPAMTAIHEHLERCRQISNAALMATLVRDVERFLEKK